jgi:hypothetical protein
MWRPNSGVNFVALRMLEISAVDIEIDSRFRGLF